MTGPTCWLIRAGERSRHARRFADRNVVALGWPDVDGLRDLTDMAPDEIRACLDQDPGTAAAGQDTAELLSFRDDVALGDVVVTPDAQTREVLVGEIAGTYEFRDPSPVDGFRHVRAVRWYGRLDRSMLPADLEAETRYRRTLRRLSHQEPWLLLAERVRDGEGREVGARGRPGAAQPRAVSAGASTRRCPGCGMDKIKGQFEAGDDRCVDCR